MAQRRRAVDAPSTDPAGELAVARRLGGDADGVVVCLPSPDEGVLAVRSDDDGATWDPWLAYGTLAGPPDCLAEDCAEQWGVFETTWLLGEGEAESEAESEGEAEGEGEGEAESEAEAEAEPLESGECGCAPGARVR